MKEDPTINYAFALKHYNLNDSGRSMKKFCEEDGDDYEKFMQYSCRGQKDRASSNRRTSASRRGGFIPLVVDETPEGALGIRNVRVRFTNGMSCCSAMVTSINDLFGMVRKMLG